MNQPVCSSAICPSAPASGLLASSSRGAPLLKLPRRGRCDGCRRRADLGGVDAPDAPDATVLVGGVEAERLLEALDFRDERAATSARTWTCAPTATHLSISSAFSFFETRESPRSRLRLVSAIWVRYRQVFWKAPRSARAPSSARSSKVSTLASTTLCQHSTGNSSNRFTVVGRGIRTNCRT